MDIIVTTPKSQMKAAAAEAAHAIAGGGGEYFRRFPIGHYPVLLKVGDRVWYVEAGYVRGCATVTRMERRPRGMDCDATGLHWAPGIYAFMDATSWRWIRPLPMRGFQGFRYAGRGCGPVAHGEGAAPANHLTVGGRDLGRIQIVGGWRDARPPAGGSAHLPGADG